MINKENINKLKDIYDNDSWAKGNITRTAKKYCKDNKIEYNDTQRRDLSRLFKSELVTGGSSSSCSSHKLLIYDIETTLLRAEVWRTGNQYVNSSSIIDEPKIITVAYKWFGDDEVHYIAWNQKKKCDRKLIKKFLKLYNSADAVIGINNDKYDNKWINSRAAKYDLEVNTYIKSIDVQKQARKLFNLPGYSMKYLAEYFGLTNKLSHSGIQMWRDIQWGSKKEGKKALKEMIDYNIGDIVATEELYIKIKKYAAPKVHFGVLAGNPKYSCPSCGSCDIKLYRTDVSAVGTISRIMKCKKDKIKFKLSNTDYLKFLEH